MHGRPQPRSCFFEQAQLECLFGDDLFDAGLLAEVLDLVGGGGADGIAGQATLAGFLSTSRGS